MGQVFQSEAETFLYPLFESDYAARATVFELRAKTWLSVLDTEDDDADWLLGGAKAEHTDWRGRISAKARSGPTSASHKICWARHQDRPQAWYESGSLSLGPGNKPVGPIFGLGVEPVDLKFASLNTKARSEYER